MINKDWTGNKATTFTTLGASNHSKDDREQHDYYATEPLAIQGLMELNILNRFDSILEPACGEGHMVYALGDYGYHVIGTDLIDRGYGMQADFLKRTDKVHGNIVTNPPFKFAEEFIIKGLELLSDDQYLCLFLKTLYLEGQGRGNGLFANNPPNIVAVCSKRVKCAINGDFSKIKSSPTSYSWFIWQKGTKVINGPTIKWILK